MNETLYPYAAIAAVALVTWALRAAPFLLFAGRPLPKAVAYLGRALPPAIMTALVIYCLRGTAFTAPSFGVPELASCALVALIHLWRRNMYLSVAAGTVCYMVLIRVMA